MAKIGFFFGSFKPPHKGHFKAIDNALNGKGVGALYKATDVYNFSVDIFKNLYRDKLDKVYVIIGGFNKGNIDSKTSKKVWDLFLKNSQLNVEVFISDNPFTKINELLNDHDEFFSITAIRKHNNYEDIRRITGFFNKKNVMGLVYKSPRVSSTLFRRNLMSKEGNPKMFLPDHISEKDSNKIIKLLKNKIKLQKIYDYSDIQNLEHLSDDNLKNELLFTLKKIIKEPFEDIFIVGSFSFAIGSSNDIDIAYIIPESYRKFKVPNREKKDYDIFNNFKIYNKQLETIFKKPIEVLPLNKSVFNDNKNQYGPFPYFDLVNLKWYGKKPYEMFNYKLGHTSEGIKWVKRS